MRSSSQRSKGHTWVSISPYEIRKGISNDCLTCLIAPAEHNQNTHGHNDGEGRQQEQGSYIRNGRERSIMDSPIVTALRICSSTTYAFFMHLSQEQRNLPPWFSESAIPLFPRSYSSEPGMIQKEKASPNSRSPTMPPAFHTFHKA